MNQKKTKKPSSPPAAADIQAAKVAAFSASQKAKVTRKVASLAKARFKVAKKTYKMTRKEAKRAAKEAKQARRYLDTCLAWERRGKEAPVRPNNLGVAKGRVALVSSKKQRR